MPIKLYSSLDFLVLTKYLFSAEGFPTPECTCNHSVHDQRPPGTQCPPMWLPHTTGASCCRRPVLPRKGFPSPLQVPSLLCGTLLLVRNEGCPSALLQSFVSLWCWERSGLQMYSPSPGYIPRHAQAGEEKVSEEWATHVIGLGLPWRLDLAL